MSRSRARAPHAALATPPPARHRRPRATALTLLILMLLTVGGGAAVWLLWPAAAPPPVALPTGPCRVQSGFTARLGYSGRAVLSSRERTAGGLTLYEPDAQGNPTRVYRDPSWNIAGFLSLPVIDRNGNVYVAPVPNINVLTNPVANATTLYRIDNLSGMMAPFLTIPAAAPPRSGNPYGILGLTYDCAHHSLYVASVAGSTRTQIAGRIVRVDLTTGTIAAQLDGVDAFGLVVAPTAHGARLLFGLARRAAVQSVALDDAGNMTADVRDELSLAGLGVRGDERARRMQLDARGQLRISTAAFSFNLTAPTDARQTMLTYDYDRTRNTWRLISTELGD